MISTGSASDTPRGQEPQDTFEPVQVSSGWLLPVREAGPGSQPLSDPFGAAVSFAEARAGPQGPPGRGSLCPAPLRRF